MFKKISSLKSRIGSRNKKLKNAAVKENREDSHTHAVNSPSSDHVDEGDLKKCQEASTRNLRNDGDSSFAYNKADINPSPVSVRNENVAPLYTVGNAEKKSTEESTSQRDQFTDDKNTSLAVSALTSEIETVPKALKLDNCKVSSDDIQQLKNSNGKLPTAENCDVNTSCNENVAQSVDESNEQPVAENSSSISINKSYKNSSSHKKKVSLTKPENPALITLDESALSKDYEKTRMEIRMYMSSGGGTSFSGTQKANIKSFKTDSSIQESGHSRGSSWGYNSSTSLQQVDFYGLHRVDRFHQMKQSREELLLQKQSGLISDSSISSKISHNRYFTGGMSSMSVRSGATQNNASSGKLNANNVFEESDAPAVAMKRDPSSYRVKPQQWLGPKRVLATGDRYRKRRSFNSMKSFSGSLYTKRYLYSWYQDLNEVYGVEQPAKKYKEKEQLSIAFATHYNPHTSAYTIVGVLSWCPRCLGGSDLVNSIEQLPQISAKHDINLDRAANSIGAGFANLWVMRNRETKRHFIAKVFDRVKLSQLDEQAKRKASEAISEERRILESYRHPFLVSSLATYQDARALYVVLDYNGGESLAELLLRVGRLQEGAALFFLAEILSATGFLHSCSIAHRAISPESISISKDGHVLLTDFSSCKFGVSSFYGCSTICGLEPYSAPEVQCSQPEGYGLISDTWSIGVLFYEMLIGKTPLPSTLVSDLERQIRDMFRDVPCNISDIAKDLLEKLICSDPLERLGATDKGIETVKSHSIFALVDWDVLNSKEYISPYTPPKEMDLADEYMSYGPGFISERDIYYPHTPVIRLQD